MKSESTNKQNADFILITTVIGRTIRAAEKASKSKRRFASYRYLRIVYRGYCKLEERSLLGRLRRVLARKFGTSKEPHQHVLRALIDATTQVRDKRMRSRWTRALEYAWNEEIEPDELIGFIKENKGLAGCARYAARALPRRRAQRDDWVDDGFEPNPPRFEQETLARWKQNPRADFDSQ